MPSFRLQLNVNTDCVDVQLSSEIFRINDLPPELLAIIFLWHVRRETEAYYAFRTKSPGWKPLCGSENPRPYSWISIRHVCRLWRDVALTTPALSTNIVPTSADRVEDLLLHSGTLPLQVVSGEEYEHSFDDTALPAYIRIFSQFHRVTQAYLQVSNKSLDILRRRNLVSESKLTALEDLQLHYLWVYGHQLQSPAPILPGVQFPRLRSFLCIGGGIHLCTPAFSISLRSFTLEYARFRITPEGLIARLEPLHNLEHIAIHHSLYEADADHFVDSERWLPSRITIFPHLRRLSIWEAETFSASMFHFLGRIGHPATTSIELGHVFESPNLPPEVVHDSLLARVRGETPERVLGTLPMLRCASVETDPTTHHVRLKLWAAAAQSPPPLEANKLPLLELFSYPAQIISLLSRLPISHVDSLRVVNAPFDTDLLSRLLACFPGSRLY